MSSTRGELLTQALMDALKTLKKRVERQQPKESDDNADSSSVTSAQADQNTQDQPPLKVTKVCLKCYFSVLS